MDHVPSLATVSLVITSLVAYCSFGSRLMTEAGKRDPRNSIGDPEAPAQQAAEPPSHGASAASTQAPPTLSARWHAGALNNGLIFGATVAGVTWLPRWGSYAIGHAGTWLAYHLLREGTAALVDNLRRVRPDADDRELHRLALRTYRCYARDTIDFIRSLDMSPERFRSMIASENADDLSALVAQGRGAIVVNAHFGNWELGGIAIRLLKGYPVTVVGRPEPSAAVGMMRRRLRESFAIESVEIGHMLETALRLRRVLAANGVVAMLMDRSMGRDRINVRFFGRDAAFSRAPAMVASLSGAPMIPASMIRQPDGRFIGWFGEPVFVDTAERGERPLQRATQAIASQLEARIGEYPHLWYQFYRYWQSGQTESAELLQLAASRPRL